MSEYRVDLLDLWRGTLSPRRVMVFITQLKPGARLHMAMGGSRAWTVEESAIHYEGQKIASAVIASVGGKQKDMPAPVEPPKIGWRDERSAADQKQNAKAAAWAKRNAKRSS